MPAPVWPAVTTASASPRWTRSSRDEDRGVLLLAERERRMLVHLDDLRSRATNEMLGGRRPGDRADARRVADEDHLVVGLPAA